MGGGARRGAPWGVARRGAWGEGGEGGGGEGKAGGGPRNGFPQIININRESENQRKPPKSRSDWYFALRFHFLRKSESAPVVDTHILVRVFGKNQGEMTSSKNVFLSKNSCPGSKADFSKQFFFCTWRLILSRYNIK